MSKRILLIEDTPELLENTAKILSIAGYDVLTATNGKEGVEIATSTLPDLIISDITMPLLNGYGALHMLSRNIETATIPFIFLTARADRSDYRKGIEMGADDYITKPFDDIELLNAVELRFKKLELLKMKYSYNIDQLNNALNNASGFEALKLLSQKNGSSQFKKRENIYRQGNIPEGLYYIKSGRAKTFKISSDGKEFITGLYKENDFFGYLPLFDESRYSDYAATLEDSEISMISSNEFYSLLDTNISISRQFRKLCIDQIRSKDEQMVRLAYNSLKKRVADGLILLFDKFAESTDTKNFSIKISREDLSNLVGTASESVIRVLKEFKEDNLIELQASTITILDYSKLLALEN
jgi:DNA-binding response OmpR family regulator